MTHVRDLIDVEHRSVRAVNLDQDLGDPDVLRGYAPGAHVVDAVRRIVVSLQDGPRTRAWSLTGPYGSGKSSFAHFLCSLFDPSGEPSHRAAAKLLRGADPQLADTITRERRRLGLGEWGVIPAVVTAEREPIADALLRALHRGAELYWSGPGRKPDVLHEIRRAARNNEAGPEDVLAIFEKLTARAPVLVVIDELGKNLEYAADRAGSDLYLLQQFAERFSSSPTFAGCVLTLAHLAFEDYLVGAGDARRREWRKIHGRFEDIPFVANIAHSITLLAEALRFTGTPEERRAIASVCESAEAGARAAAEHPPLAGELLDSPAATYPLHPSAAIALPALAAQLGQHDRSLVAFLASDAPHALPSFLSLAQLDAKRPPFVRVADIYDYFFADGAAAVITGPEGERAREIEGRINEAHGFDTFELRVLKTVGILNLLSGSVRLMASGRLVEEAVVGPQGTAKERSGVQAVLRRLAERGLLIYRDFAGEYRVWQGSDFDARAQVSAARERLTSGGHSDEQVLRIVAEAHPVRPAVARRHSQQLHTLRYFECRYARTAPAKDVEVQSEDAAGLVLYVLADRTAPKALPAKTASGHPLVVVWSPYGSEVRDAALDFAAARAVLAEASELERDAVARREMRHRVAALQRAVADRADEAFDPSRRGVWCFASGRRRKPGTSAEFSRLLSELCDKRFPRTPVIRNEMVNRRELTSQGAKARRILLERMFTHEDEPRLAIEGYGPERSMYEAVLHYTGLHSPRGERWGFGAPPRDSDVADVWKHLMSLLDAAAEDPLGIDEVYRELLQPPFGMKVGVIPLLLAAALQYRADDVFLYQDGTFQPVAEPTHIERLLKAPERFSLKRASLVGVRASVFEQLRQTLAPTARARSVHRLRNETTLAVVRPLIAFVNGLPDYTRQTKRTSETAQHVCVGLLNAREPDELLFTILPQACGLSAFRADPDSQDERAAREYVERLRTALAELGSEYPRLLEKIGDLLHTGFRTPGPRRSLREDLRSRSRGLLQQVIEPKMRSFLATAADEQLDDQDWLEALAMTLASKPPSSWTDHDVTVFEALVAERAQWFCRLELLYHEMHGRQAAGFDARRVTLTAPDGRETAELVRVDPATHELVGDVLDRALSELEGRLGAGAPQALFGVMATRLLPTEEGDNATEDVADKRRRVN